MKMFSLASLVGLTAGSVLAADGTFWGKNDDGSLNWSARECWFNHTYACDGGVAWFNDSQLDAINQDVEGLTLSGFQFGIRWMHVTGFPITFSAPFNWITHQSNDSGAHKPGFDVAFRGTGSNVVSINDYGTMHMRVPAENLGTLQLLGSRLKAWNATGDCFTTGDFQLSEGVAAIDNQTDAALDISIASTEGKRFVYGPSLGLLEILKGAGPSAMLTIGRLARFTGGGVMAIQASGGLDNLGGTEKVKVASGAPVNVNGICDASIVGYSQTSPYPLSFLAYDETDGFTKASVTPVDFQSATANDVASINGNATISGEKHVHALYVNGQSTLDFSDGAVLKVGDDLHPAGIIFNSLDGGGIQPNLTGSGGTIAFGGSQGCIYFNNPAGSSALTINQTIAGTGGVVFSGGFNGTKNTISLAAAAGWAGPTVVTRATLCIAGSDQLPTDGDVYILSGRDGQRGGSLRITTTMTFGENQRFHFGGWGTANEDGGVVHVGGASPVFTFNGPVELCGPGGFLSDGASCRLVFNGGISGYGWWQFGQGEYVFANPLSYTGVMRLFCPTTTLAFEGTGCPAATTSFEYRNSAATLMFRSLAAPLDFTNPVKGGGKILITDADVKLNGDQTYDTITIGKGAKVGIGANVKFNRIVFAGGEVYALDGAADVALRIGADDGFDAVLNGTTAISNNLGVVKLGGNTVTIARDANVAKSLHITDGTVKLDSSIMMTAGVSYWLDAANGATVSADADGRATQWISANGNGATFRSSDKAPMYVNMVNNHKVLSFENDGMNYNRFNSTGEFVQRAMFFCLAPRMPTWGSTIMSAWGWSGKGNPEYGLRYQPFSGGWGTLEYATAFRMNGQDGKFDFYPDGTAQIVGEFNSSGENDTFPASVGGYEGWAPGNNFNGDIYEVIAFDRDVTSAEIDEIENYLSEKWGLKDLVWHEGVVEHEVLGEAVTVKLAPSGVFDLNGVNQTIGSLIGEGTVTNSSDRAAVLTVTGVCSFSGRIAGNVTVRMANGGTLAVEIPDAVVEVAGGVTQFGVYAEMPPTNGILYWLDAAWSAPDAITWQNEEAKTVASVKSRLGVVDCFVKGFGCPTFVERAIGGNKPAFRFTGSANNDVPSLYTSSTISTKTIVLVMQLPDSAYYWNYFWGRYGYDKGFRLLNFGDFDLGYGSQNWAYAFSATGDYQWFNGEKTQIAYNSGGFRMEVGEPARFITTRASWHQDDSYENVQDCIGSYENRDCNMYIGEVISYDHVLSDDEVAHLEGYLKAKWFTSGSIPAVRTQVFGAESTLAANGGEADLSGLSEAAVGTLKSGPSGGTVTGDLAVSGFEYDAQNEAAAMPFCVKGSLTIADGAEFSAINLGSLKRTNWTLLASDSSAGAFGDFTAGPRKWAFNVSANAWGIASPGMLLLFK